MNKRIRGGRAMQNNNQPNNQPKMMPKISDSDTFSQVVNTEHNVSLQRTIKRLRISTISEFLKTDLTILTKKQYLERKGVPSSYIHNTTYRKLTTLLSQDSYKLRPRITNHLNHLKGIHQASEILQPLHRFIAFQTHSPITKKRKFNGVA
jgi:hypothetical protein